MESVDVRRFELVHVDAIEVYEALDLRSGLCCAFFRPWFLSALCPPAIPVPIPTQSRIELGKGRINNTSVYSLVVNPQPH